LSHAPRGAPGACASRCRSSPRASPASCRLRSLTELNAVRAQAAQESKELGRELSTLRKDLATSEVAREAAQSEAAGMRAEVERLGRELVGARENVGDHKAGLAQAEALLAEARALTASLREQ
jgi:chromosome segregation ATPase